MGVLKNYYTIDKSLDTDEKENNYVIVRLEGYSPQGGVSRDLSYSKTADIPLDVIQNALYEDVENTSFDQLYVNGYDDYMGVTLGSKHSMYVYVPTCFTETISVLSQYGITLND